MRLNISQAKTYRENPVKWYYRYVLGRESRAAASAALSVGTAFHTFMEFYPEGMEAATLQISAEYARLVRENHADAAADLRKEWDQLAAILPHWSDRFDFQTLSVETELEATLPSGKHTLYGRPDRIAVWSGRLWHIQNRSLAGSKPIATYLKAAILDPHELGYAWLIGQEYPKGSWNGIEFGHSYGGTLFNIVRKLQLVGKNGKQLHSPDECFVQEFIPISPGLVEQNLRGLEQIADEMEAIIEGTRPRPYLCSDACRLGSYGNSLCSYFPVCAQQADIHDDRLYRDAVDPYALRAEEAEVTE